MYTHICEWIMYVCMYICIYTSSVFLSFLRETYVSENSTVRDEETWYYIRESTLFLSLLAQNLPCKLKACCSEQLLKGQLPNFFAPQAFIPHHWLTCSAMSPGSLCHVYYVKYCQPLNPWTPCLWIQPVWVMCYTVIHAMAVSVLSRQSLPLVSFLKQNSPIFT